MNTIVTEQFTLRPWREDDAKALTLAANNIEIWKNLRDGFPNPYTIDDAKAFIASVGKLLNLFAIEVDGRAVGSIGYFPQSGVESHCGEVGYFISEECWGRGIMSEAVQALATFVFANTTLTRLFATPYSYNPSSMRVLEKAGFLKVGVMHKAEMKNGVAVDKHYYELLK